MGRQRLSASRQALRDVGKLLRCARDFMGCLAVPEQQQLRNKMVGAILATAGKKGLNLTAIEDPDILAMIDQWMEDVDAKATAAYKERREVRPRLTERDREIERLRDEVRANKKQRSWGEIALQLRHQNPKWAKPDGSPLADDTVRIAYRRTKQRPDK